MQLTAFSILCFLLCSQTLAVRDLKDSTSRSSSQARASASAAASTSGGSVRVVSTARAFSISEPRQAFQSSIVEAIAIAEAGGNAEAMASQAVSVFADAIATAFVEASVNIVSTSPGATACGSASVSAEASASASARALVEVLGQASSPNLFASASDAIEAVGSVTVNAFASANVNACVNGVGHVEAMASQLASVVGTAFAEVTAAVLASASPESAIVEIDVTSVGDRLIVTTIESRGVVDTSGNDVHVDGGGSFSAGGER